MWSNTNKLKKESTVITGFQKYLPWWQSEQSPQFHFSYASITIVAKLSALGHATVNITWQCRCLEILLISHWCGSTALKDCIPPFIAQFVMLPVPDSLTNTHQLIKIPSKLLIVLVLTFVKKCHTVNNAWDSTTCLYTRELLVWWALKYFNYLTLQDVVFAEHLSNRMVLYTNLIIWNIFLNKIINLPGQGLLLSVTQYKTLWAFSVNSVH